MRSSFHWATRKPAVAVGALALGLAVFSIWLNASRKLVVSRDQKPPKPPSLTNVAVVTSVDTSSSPRIEPDADEHEVVGIGAALRRPNVANGVVQIERVLPGSPAELAGLRPFMNIHKVDGISLRGLPLSETTQLIRGPVGSRVTLELNEGVDGNRFTVELIRARIKL